jgi:thiol:disulfide interchange protein DsbA
MSNLLRHLLLLMLLACALPLAGVRAADTATPPPFQEGKDYVRLPTPVPTSVPDKAEVIEFFSYTCPHCNDLEPVAHEWLKRKPENVTFVRIAVAFGATWEPGARAYYAAEALGVLDKVHQPLFDAIHREKRKLSSEDELAALFAEHGVDQDAFRKAYKSFQTETQMRRGNQLAQRYGVRGVPGVIVNGQYEVRSPRIFEVVDYLLAQ